MFILNIHNEEFEEAWSYLTQLLVENMSALGDEPDPMTLIGDLTSRSKNYKHISFRESTENIFILLDKLELLIDNELQINVINYVRERIEKLNKAA